MMKPNLRFIGRSTITLLVVLAAIFLRGNIRDFTVLGLLAAVIAYNLFVFFRPKWMLAMDQYEANKEAARAIKPKKSKVPLAPEAQQHVAQPQALPQVSAAPPVMQVQPKPSQAKQDDYRDTLVRHVNYRITEKLKGVYPDATWAWCIKDPIALIQQGGATRIRTFHTEGHDFAEVEFSANGNFRVCMIQVLELDGGKRPVAKPATAESGETDPDNINLYDWYEMTASAVVRATIDEVVTRGHHVLFIDASGDIFTKEGDESVRQGKVGFMPSAKLWDELIPFFAEDDITASVDGETLALTWAN